MHSAIPHDHKQSYVTPSRPISKPYTRGIKESPFLFKLQDLFPERNTPLSLKKIQLESTQSSPPPLTKKL
jgi:hypothetical protein